MNAIDIETVRAAAADCIHRANRYSSRRPDPQKVAALAWFVTHLIGNVMHPSDDHGLVTIARDTYDGLLSECAREIEDGK